MKITANFDRRILNISGMLGNIKSDINLSLKEAGTLVKSNIKAELRSPNKTGATKPSRRFRASPRRRSAPGESLARDTGASERLISSEKTGNSKMEVGFKENPYGFDYIAYQELERNRPTVQFAVEKSFDEIQNIFERNLTPKF